MGPETKSRSPVGVLLVQLGTPDSTAVSDVRRYLREFLSDPRVLDIPAPARVLLLNAVILPFRPRRSAEQYRKIWTDRGSPLLINTDLLARALAEELGSGYRVTVGMRYQNPSLEVALERLTAAGCTQIVIVPLFPQYSSAAFGSAVARILDLASAAWNVPALSVLPPFYDHPGFVRSVAAVTRPQLDGFGPDHVLFSYHGLPEQQIRKSDPDGWCLTRSNCCETISVDNAFCYRAQCYATSRTIANKLELDVGDYSTSFQSRLAGQKWIEPYTDRILTDLHGRGVRRLAVLTPSFVADCLETLEEIGIRLREQWSAMGDGTDLLLVPCVNASPIWARELATMVSGLRESSDGDKESVGGEGPHSHPFAID